MTAAAKRFRPGHAHGGALAVVDTQRKGRAVCIMLPDPEKPKAPARLAEIFADALNSLHERRKDANPEA